MKIEIRISGSGTREEIVKSLLAMTEDLRDTPESMLCDLDWEDETLLLETGEYQEDEEDDFLYF